ncbi:MAG TPA: septum site-determining protein MinC [Gammaproteobacteria bacterium]|nr:septum site-determining protein MinC [Gammaproteobacteria bacterium]
MSNYTNVPAEITLMFQLKGGLYPLTALQLIGTNLLAFEEQLIAKIEQAPKFFYNAPVVIDLQKLTKPDAHIDYQQLVGILRSKKLIPIGIKGGTTEQQAAATLVGLPILQDSSRNSAKTETTEDPSSSLAGKLPTSAEALPAADQETDAEIRGSNTKLITEPVRSGQQIYARGGDLIVLAPVSHGAELLADGHIHIYGPLRGRALAGVTGDETARIFCQYLEAELISIAGQYKISEDIEQSVWRMATYISLKEDRLHIRPL